MWASRLASLSCLPTRPPPQAIVCWPCGMGLGCSALQAKGLGKDWRSCACFVFLHNCLIKDIPGMTYLSKRGQVSSELGVPHPSSTVLSCPRGALLYNMPISCYLCTYLTHSQTALSAQVQVCLASTPGSASSQHWPYVACIALPPNTEARSSPLAQPDGLLGCCGQGSGALQGGHTVLLFCLRPTPWSPWLPLLAFCGPQQPRSSVGLVKLACFLGQSAAVERTHGQQANFLTLNSRMWSQEGRGHTESPVHCHAPHAPQGPHSLQVL